MLKQQGGLVSFGDSGWTISKRLCSDVQILSTHWTISTMLCAVYCTYSTATTYFSVHMLLWVDYGATEAVGPEHTYLIYRYALLLVDLIFDICPFDVNHIIRSSTIC